MTDYFKEGYQDRIDEINKIEGEINRKITEIKSKSKSESTISLEKEIDKLLNEFSSKLSTLREKYRNPPSEIPPIAINKRKATIESLGLNLERIKKNFDEAKKQKYGMNFTSQGMSEETRNNIRFMDNQQLYDHGQQMLKGQDDKIEQITKDIVHGKKVAKEIHHDVENQIVKLDHLHQNVFFIFFLTFLDG